MDSGLTVKGFLSLLKNPFRSFIGNSINEQTLRMDAHFVLTPLLVVFSD